MGTADLTTRLGPLTLRNPVMTASGTCGYGLELEPYVDLSRLGALVLKGLSAEPREGNPPPRIVETPSGLLNSIGLENIGVRRFVAEVLPVLRTRDVPLVANVYATSAEDFIGVAAALEEAGGVAALELNLSCPNVSAGGISFGQDPCLASNLVEAVRRRVSLPLLVKLTPRVTDITVPARACEEAGADGLTVANTWPGMAVDLARRAPLLGNAVGGLSGPAIKPLSLRLVWETSRAVKIPVIGCGGIGTWTDAAEYLVAGARAVQVGTAALVAPSCLVAVVDGLADHLSRGD